MGVAAVKLEEVTVTTGNKTTPTAVITVDYAGEKKIAAAYGAGVIDAVAKAMTKVYGAPLKLEAASCTDETKLFARFRP